MTFDRPFLVIMKSHPEYFGYDCLTLDEAFAVAALKRLGDLAGVYNLNTNTILHVEHPETSGGAIIEVISRFKN